MTDALLQAMTHTIAVALAIAFCLGFLSSYLGEVAGRFVGALVDKRLTNPTCRDCVQFEQCKAGQYYICSGFERRKRNT